MNSRERLLTALSHKEPDRVPLDIGQTIVTGITKKAYQNLLHYLGLEGRNITICDITQQLAGVDEDILKQFGVDVRGFYPEAPSDWELAFTEDDAYSFFSDEWGIVRRTQKTGGLYYDLWKSPFAEVTEENFDQYKWPKPVDPKRINNLIKKAEVAGKEGEYAVAMGACPVLGASYLTQFQLLVGFVEAYVNLVGEPELSNKFFDKFLELDLAFWEWFLPQAGQYIDIILTGDDVAGQNGLLISQEMIQRYLKPRFKKLFATIHKLAPHIKIIFHSCGAVYDVIPDLIDIGVDVLNPVQLSAAGMDIKKLKKEFGRDLSFWGGGVDTQYTLPHGTPSQVEEEVKRNLEILMPGGGYVFNPVHNIQADVPPENIIAMVEAVHKYGKY